LQNAQLYSREQRRRQQMEAIYSVARQTTSVLELDELLNELCRVILQSFPVDHVSVVLYEDGHLVVSRAHGSLTPRVVQGERLPDNPGLCARALATGEPVIENDVSKVPGYIPGYDEARSEVCLPLISFGQPLGVLVLDSVRLGAFDPDEVLAMQSVAD